MTLHLGILLALLCAFASNLGFFFKHRGCCEAPTIDVRHPLRSAKGLWCSKWFAIGMAVGGGAWALHVPAISLVPLSVVEGVLFAMGGLLILGPRAGAPAEHHGVMLAAASGILFGVCNVAVKALTGLVGHEGVFGLASPWLLVAAAGSATAFYASAKSLQDGEAVEVIAITGTAANISCIAGGIIVFGDPMPGTALGIVVQAFAFVLVVTASALTPAPVRSAERVATATA